MDKTAKIMDFLVNTADKEKIVMITKANNYNLY